MADLKQCSADSFISAINMFVWKYGTQISVNNTDSTDHYVTVINKFRADHYNVVFNMFNIYFFGMCNVGYRTGKMKAHLELY